MAKKQAAAKKKGRPYSFEYRAADSERARKYLLSGIPAKLWIRFQARCKREHIAMRQVLLNHVEAWTNRPGGEGGAD